MQEAKILFENGRYTLVVQVKEEQLQRRNIVDNFLISKYPFKD